MDEEFLKLLSDALYEKLKLIIIYLDAARIEGARHCKDLWLSVIPFGLKDNKEAKTSLTKIFKI